MMQSHSRIAALTIIMLLCATPVLRAGGNPCDTGFNSGSDESDGAFAPATRSPVPASQSRCPAWGPHGKQRCCREVK